MNKLLKSFPVFAFAIAMGAAFAANSAAPVVGTLKAKINGTWTVIAETQHYRCDNNPQHDCVARFDAQNQIITGTLVKGDYVPLP